MIKDVAQLKKASGAILPLRDKNVNFEIFRPPLGDEGKVSTSHVEQTVKMQVTILRPTKTGFLYDHEQQLAWLGVKSSFMDTRLNTSARLMRRGSFSEHVETSQTSCYALRILHFGLNPRSKS